MRKEILFIYNPSSGKALASQLISETVELLCNENYRVTVYPVSRNLGAEDILKEEDGIFENIICCGGDGTLNHTINGMMSMNNKPMLTYIPAGSTNDFAASLGIDNGVKNAVDAIVKNTPYYYDIGKFNTIYFNYIAAFGAFTQVSYSTPQSQKNYLGHAAYVIEGIRHLPIGQYHTVTITVNGETFTDDYIYGSVSNSTSIGGMSIPIKDEVSMNDGLFEVILIKAPKTIMDLQSIIAALLIQNYDSSFIQYFKTHDIHFEFKDETPWTLDGEFGGNISSADITVINQAIPLLK